MRASLHFTTSALRQFSPNVIEPLSARFDVPVENEDAFLPHYALVASHQSFGFHARFTASRFSLVTILRKPEDRVVSAYTYGCMRGGRAPTPEAFEHFISDEANTNRAVKQLAGQADYRQPAGPETLTRARVNLERRFDAYVTDRNVTALTSYFLSRLRLANVVSNRINETAPTYRFDAAPWREALAERNHLDRDLYAFVAAAPRMPQLLPHTSRNALHPLTILMIQNANNLHAEANYGVYRTAALAKYRPKSDEDGMTACPS